jgi:ABC-type sugar transport system ATPase subunit
LVEVRDRIAGIKLPGGGTVRARLPKGADASALATGERIVVAVRPEHVSVDTSDHATHASEANRVTGVLRSVEYVGSDSIYVIDAAPAGNLMVRQRGTGPAITVGKEIALTFSPEDSVALTDPDPQSTDLDALGLAHSGSAASHG